MAEKERKTMKDMFQNGLIMQEWTSTCGVSVVPCPDIDRVKVSIVAKGTQGQDSTSHYIGIEDFRALCDDILSPNEIALQRFKNDNKSDFPEAYVFNSGEQKEDGKMDITSKCAFGAGKKGPAIQVNNRMNDGKWKNKLIGVRMKDLRTMAFHFKLIMGLIPVQPGTYYDGLIQAFYQGNAERTEKYHKGNRPASASNQNEQGFEPATGQANEGNPWAATNWN